MRVHIATNNWVAQRLHVYPKLVRSTGDRFELYKGPHLSALNDLKIGEGVLAAFVANHLLGPVRPVGCDRQFDSARILVELAPQNRRVFFFNLAALKLPGEFRQARFVLGHNHNA